MTSEFDPPVRPRSQSAKPAANAPELTVLDGGRERKNTVVDVITGKIHDLPEHYLLPVTKKE